MSDEIDPYWCLPPRPTKPLPQVARLTAEVERLHSLLVKACVEIAEARIRNDRHPMRIAGEIQIIKTDYGIRLRWTGATFEEDTTK